MYKSNLQLLAETDINVSDHFTIVSFLGYPTKIFPPNLKLFIDCVLNATGCIYILGHFIIANTLREGKKCLPRVIEKDSHSATSAQGHGQR